MVNLFGRTDEYLLVNGKMVNNMELVRFSTRKESVEQENGFKARKFDGLTKSKLE